MKCLIIFRFTIITQSCYVFNMYPLIFQACLLICTGVTDIACAILLYQGRYTVNGSGNLTVVPSTVSQSQGEEDKKRCVCLFCADV